MWTNLLTKRTMNDDGSSSRRRPPSYNRSSVLRIDPNHSNQNDIVLEQDTIGMNDNDEDAGGERATGTTSDYMNRDAADDDADDGREEEHPPSQLQPQQPQSPPVSFYFYHSPTKNSNTNTNTASTSGSAPSKDFPPPHHPMGETTQSSSLPRMMSQHPHHPQRPLLLPPPPALPYTTKSQHHHHKTTTLLDDCESGISMNCRCRKATMIMMTFLVAIVIAFYSNISLVIKLGAVVHKDSHYNNDHPNNIIHHPYDAYHKFQQMILSSPTTTSDTAITSSSSSSSSSKNKKSRIDTAMIGDDDDPLEGSDDDGSNGEEDDDGTSTTTAVDAITTDDGTALDSFTSVTDIQATSSSSSLHQKNKRLSPSSPKPMNRKYNKYSKQKQRANNTNKKKKNNNNNNNNNKRLHPHQTEPKRNNAKANIQDIVPTPESMSVNASFSACLLIKDDNEILSEWIAYHYHTIKLRQLIVAVDPLSSESPTILLAKWKLLTDLNIRLWHDEHYMPDDFMETGQAPPNFIATETDLKHSKMRAESILEISNHRYRQRVFLSSCLRSMRAEGNSWVIHIDTDEYVVPSKLLRQMKPRYVVIPPIEQPGSVLSLIQQVVEKTARSVNYPCISMLRVLFGSVESSIEEQNVGVPEMYNATAFESLRWRYHALPHDAELHGNPKVILDVQAIPAKYFEETIVFSIHRPVREYCPKNSDLAFSNFRKQPIAVNHYLGSWERYSGRNDKRRSRDKYDLRATVNRGHDDGLRTWLQGFVTSVGPSHAAKLLGEPYLSRNYPHLYDDSTSTTTTTNHSNNTTTSNSIKKIYITPPSENSAPFVL